MMENFFISESSAVVVRHLLLVLLAEMSFWFNIDRRGEVAGGSRGSRKVIVMTKFGKSIPSVRK